MSQFVIQLDDVAIRPFHPHDAADQYAIVADPRVANMLLQVPSTELAETERWAVGEKNGFNGNSGGTPICGDDVE